TATAGQVEVGHAGRLDGDLQGPHVTAAAAVEADVAVVDHQMLHGPGRAGNLHAAGAGRLGVVDVGGHIDVEAVAAIPGEVAAGPGAVVGAPVVAVVAVPVPVVVATPMSVGQVPAAAGEDVRPADGEGRSEGRHREHEAHDGDHDEHTNH